MFYAQINDDNICICVSNTGKATTTKPNMIQLETYDLTVLGKRYNNGVWEEVPQPEPEPSQLDRIETLLNTSYTDAQNAAVDAYTQQLIEEGTL